MYPHNMLGYFLVTYTRSLMFSNVHSRPIETLLYEFKLTLHCLIKQQLYMYIYSKNCLTVRQLLNLKLSPYYNAT